MDYKIIYGKQQQQSRHSFGNYSQKKQQNEDYDDARCDDYAKTGNTLLNDGKKNEHANKNMIRDDNDDDDDDDFDANFAKVDFALMGADEIRRRSVAELNSYALYERALPKIKGPNDPAMGPGADRRICCATCGNKVDLCPGHAAHIELPYPMYHAWFFSNTLKILRCVCFWCCRLLLDDDDSKLLRILKTTESKQRLQAIFEQTKLKRQCPRCELPQPTYKKSAMMNVTLEWANYQGWLKKHKKSKVKVFEDVPDKVKQCMESDTPFTAASASQILQAVPDLDYARMGIDPRVSHPSFQVLKAMAVGPPSIRPSISSVEGSRARGQDDITSSYIDLLAQVRSFYKARDNIRRFRDQDILENNTKNDMMNEEDDQEVHEKNSKPITAATGVDDDLEKNNTLNRKRTHDQIDDDDEDKERHDAVADEEHVQKDEKYVQKDEKHVQKDKGKKQDNHIEQQQQQQGKGDGKEVATGAATKKKRYTSFFQMRREKMLNDVLDVDKSLYPSIPLPTTVSQDELRFLVEPTEAHLNDVPKKHLTDIQMAISVLQSNNIKGPKTGRQRSGKNRKSLQHRFKSKGGRWRLTIGGKRVNFSARTVIGPDPNIDIDTVAVPEKICTAITFPEQVTDFNIHKLQDCVIRGPNVVDGALQIETDNGNVIYLDMVDHTKTKIKVGWIVHRHIHDGDYAIFNRQPSLHKLSTMAFKVKVIKGNTIRFNWIVSTPYNADFDGDEMNLHFVQDCMATAELMELMYVPKLTVDPAKNKTAFGPIQDGVIGTWLLTQQDTFFTYEETVQLIMQRSHATELQKTKLPTPAILKPRPMWTGKQIFAQVIPKGVYFEKGGWGNPSTNGISENGEEKVMDPIQHVLIEDGEVLSGVLDKSVIGITHGSLNQIIWRDCGEAAVVAFNSDLVRVVNYYNKKRGFSVSYKDCMISDEGKIAIKLGIEKIKTRMNQMMESDIANYIPPNILETSLQSIANKSLQVVGAQVNKYVDVQKNSIMQMVRSGAKGNEINPINICALVGQQNANGRRIAVANTHKLPCFAPCDKSPEAHAFIDQPYSTGVPANQFFYHCICGCDGLVDTACNTSETGYLQRRMQKAMECIQVYTDGSIRKISDGELIAFSYGNDGYDASKLERFMLHELVDVAKCKHLCVDLDTLQKNIHIPISVKKAKAKEWKRQQFITVREAHRLEKLVHLYTKQETNILTPKLDEEVHVPVNVARLIKRRVTTKFHYKTTLTPTKLSHMRIHLLKQIRKNASMFDKITLVEILIAKYLSTRYLIVEHHATEEDVEKVCNEFLREYLKSRVVHGEMVGSLAADSHGAPATQMTLNTFHYAGVASTSVHITQGVPRLIEILAASKKVKTPSMRLALKPPFNHSARGAKMAQKLIEYITLETVVTNVDYLSISDFIMSMNIAPYHPIVMEREAGNIVIVLRIVVEPLINKNMTPLDVKRAIDQYLNGTGITYCSDTSDETWYVGIRLRLIQTMAHRVPKYKDEIEKSICRRFLQYCLTQCYIAGIPKVKKAIPLQQEDGTWYLQTQGSALDEMKFMECVDFSNSFTNHIYEACEVMGINIAAKILFKELHTVLTSDGQYINHRHIRVLVETMCHYGWLMPVNRHGINRVEKSVFSKANFEQQIEVLTDAALFGYSDAITGVTETNTVGSVGKFGTGSFDILLDQDMMTKMLQERKHTREDMVVPATTTTATDMLTNFLVDFAREEDTRSRHNAANGSFKNNSKPHEEMFGYANDYDDDDNNSNNDLHDLHMDKGNDNDKEKQEDLLRKKKKDNGTAHDYNNNNNNNNNQSHHPYYSPTCYPLSPAYDPSRPTYEPSSPAYEPTSPTYEPTSPVYEPSSPAYDPCQSPTYGPSSPAYDPGRSPAYDYPASPMYEPCESPTSPCYEPADTMEKKIDNNNDRDAQKFVLDDDAIPTNMSTYCSSLQQEQRTNTDLPRPYSPINDDTYMRQQKNTQNVQQHMMAIQQQQKNIQQSPEESPTKNYNINNRGGSLNPDRNGNNQSNNNNNTNTNFFTRYSGKPIVPKLPHEYKKKKDN